METGMGGNLECEKFSLFGSLNSSFFCCLLCIILCDVRCAWLFFGGGEKPSYIIHRDGGNFSGRARESEWKRWSFQFSIGVCRFNVVEACNFQRKSNTSHELNETRQYRTDEKRQRSASGNFARFSFRLLTMMMRIEEWKCIFALSATETCFKSQTFIHVALTSHDDGKERCSGVQ